MELEHSYINTNGIRLHVVQAGPKSGIPVVLLHGFPEFWYGWRKQIPALVEAGCRVIIPDQRGYNLSDKPKGIKNYKVYTLVEDIIGLIAALEYERVNLVGHNWGAVVAWLLANKYPERLQRLSILNVPHPTVMRRFLLRDFEQMRRSWYIFLFQLPWLPEAGMRRDNWRGAEYALRGSGKIHTFTNEDIEKYKEAWSQPNAVNSMLNWYRASQILVPPPGLAVDVPDWVLRAFPKIKVPVRVIWGLEDKALLPIQLEGIGEVDDNIEVFPLKGVGHFAPWEAPEKVVEALKPFLLAK